MNIIFIIIIFISIITTYIIITIEITKDNH